MQRRSAVVRLSRARMAGETEEEKRPAISRRTENENGAEMCRRALEAGVSIVPGRAFSLGSGYSHYIRLSCTTAFDSRIERGVAVLGRLVDDLAGR